MPPRILPTTLAVALLFAVLGIAATWPVVSDPAHLSLAGPNNNDFHFNTYVVMWGAHALTTAPLQLHHTNMFWPERYTFAYSDMELAHSLLVMPLLAFWYNPTLAINVLLLLSIVIGGTGAFWLARYCTHSTAAALLAATIFAFNDAHFGRHLQIQFFGDHWAPWLALATLRWLDRPTPGRALTTSLFFVLHALTGSHSAVFAAVIVGTLCAVHLLRSGAWRRSAFWRSLPAFVLPALFVLAPLFYPYLIVQDRLALERGDSAEILLEGSARTRDLLSGSSRVHAWLDDRFGWPSALGGDRLRAHLFPGFLPLLLALASLLPSPRRASARPAVPPRAGDLIAWLVLVGVCLALALGPRFGLYQLLAMVPGIKLIRVPSRFVLPALLGLSVLAAYGWQALDRRLRPARARLLLLAMVTLFAIESIFAPLPTARIDPGPDEIAGWIAAQPGQFAVLEIPVAVDNLTIHVRQVRQSQYHWKRLLVGYSGWRSPEVEARLERIERNFPAAGTLDELAELEVRFIVVLERRVPQATLDALDLEPRLQRAAELTGAVIWELDPDRWRLGAGR
jgi:hypothetical protein